MLTTRAQYVRAREKEDGDVADRQRLKVTLKKISNDREWTHQSVEITADPENHDEIRPEIIRLARELDGRGNGDPWWADQYKGHVQGIDQHWWDFWLPGGGN